MKIESKQWPYKKRQMSKISEPFWVEEEFRNLEESRYIRLAVLEAMETETSISSEDQKTAQKNLESAIQKGTEMLISSAVEKAAQANLESAIQKSAEELGTRNLSNMKGNAVMENNVSSEIKAAQKIDHAMSTVTRLLQSRASLTDDQLKRLKKTSRRYIFIN